MFKPITNIVNYSNLFKWIIYDDVFNYGNKGLKYASFIDG